jgi:hypothetical protein
MTGAAQSGAAPMCYQTERAVMPQFHYLPDPDQAPAAQALAAAGLEIVKQAFFEKVLTIPILSHQQPHYRFVAWATKLDEDYGDAKIHAIWNPNENRDRPYNLVLSLASNGKHYPLIDWDLPDRPTEEPGKPTLGVVGSSSNIWFRSGSGNWHGYCNGYATSFTTAVLIAQHPHVDEKDNEYAKHVLRAGYATLRPPWLPKGGLGVPWVPRTDDAMPDGFLDGIIPPGPPEPERNAWEELFND